ncbi:MAG: DUF58 domain-containing protein [Deltaproteobacteria bacterium]|nr:DUF58 domain-containing protein [Deltaproteobacteria bacterium]
MADRFPWTLLGLLGVAVATIALGASYQMVDLTLLVVGWVTVGLVSLSTAAVLAGALLIGLRVRKRRRAREEGERWLELETERPQPSGFELPRDGWIPLLQSDWELEAPADVSLDVEERLGKRFERLIAHRRGERAGLRRRFRVRDAFRLAGLGLRDEDSLKLRILPHKGKLTRLPVLTSFAGGEDWPHPMGVAEGDRTELRRYAPGDPARFIHWKVFARTKKLVVRMPERALTRARRTVAYLVSGSADEASAGAARVAIESVSLGEEWSFGADGHPDPTSSMGEALDAIVRSAATPFADGAAHLEPFLRRAEKRGPASLVVFVPAEPGPWLERTVAALRPRAGRVRIVVGVDGLAVSKSRSALRRLFTEAAPLDASDAAALDEVLAALAPLRAEVLVLDRKSGRVLSEAHRRAARGAKGEEKKPKKAEAA